MKIFKSLLGIILSLLIFPIVWFVSDLVFDLVEPVLRWWVAPGATRDFLQELMRPLIPVGVGGYITMLGLIQVKIVEEYNKKFIFLRFFTSSYPALWIYANNVHNSRN